MEERKYTHQRGYLLLYRPEHPFCDNHGYIPEHRLIMEQQIGRFIDIKNEEVHHIDKNVKNNKVDNLILLTRLEHTRIHRGWSFKNRKWYKICSGCKRELEVNEKNFTKRNTGAMFVSECKECGLLRVKNWKHKNPKYFKNQRKHLVQ